LVGSKATPSTSISKTITEDEFMTRKLPKRGLPPMHPGELLREEILPALDRPGQPYSIISPAHVARDQIRPHTTSLSEMRR
jgi:hypothetical protein